MLTHQWTIFDDFDSDPAFGFTAEKPRKQLFKGKTSEGDD
jgi:hypothetical protein